MIRISALFAAAVLAFSVHAADVRPDNLVTPIGASPEVLVPAAGSVQGANGTYFHSDMTLLNYTNRVQSVRLTWLPNPPATAAQFTPMVITVQPMSGIQSDDFVAEVMGIRSGLGAILITGVAANGMLDASARLYVTNRIWTPQPGSQGTVSQSFNTIGTIGYASASSETVVGLKRNDAFRSNAGIVNFSGASQRFHFTTGDLQGDVTIPAMSSFQFPVPGASSPYQLVITNTTDPSIQTNRWICYASSVDNYTGDSWSELGFTPFVDITP